MMYTFENLKIAMHTLQLKYPFIEFDTIGKSVMGRHLYSMRLGKGPNAVICVGVHHALEWLTGVMLVCFADAYASAYESDAALYGHNVRDLFESASIYVIPMLNPDGVELNAGRIPKSDPYYVNIVDMCGKLDFPAVWQANINGVDLNHNYDALWAEGVTMSGEAVLSPGPTRYGGGFPESEPESRALAEFTRKINPAMVIAYHSQGREIFYDFNGKAPQNTETLANEMARLSGYTLVKPEGFAGFGGYKDWFIDKFDRPGFTVEIGHGKNPIGLDQLAAVLEENTPVILYAASMAAGADLS